MDCDQPVYGACNFCIFQPIIMSDGTSFHHNKACVMYMSQFHMSKVKVTSQRQIENLSTSSITTLAQVSTINLQCTGCMTHVYVSGHRTRSKGKFVSEV